MARHTVKDKLDLPLDCSHYVRSLSDPAILIHGTTGDSYVLESGEPWTVDGYKRLTDAGRSNPYLEVAHNKMDTPKR